MEYIIPEFHPKSINPGDIVGFKCGGRVIVAKVDYGNTGTLDPQDDDARYARVYWRGKGFNNNKAEFKCRFVSEIISHEPRIKRDVLVGQNVECTISVGKPDFDQAEITEPNEETVAPSVAKLLHHLPGSQPCDCGKGGTTIPNGKCRLCLDCGQGVGSCSI